MYIVHVYIFVLNLEKKINELENSTLLNRQTSTTYNSQQYNNNDPKLADLEKRVLELELKLVHYDTSRQIPQQIPNIIINNNIGDKDSYKSSTNPNNVEKSAQTNNMESNPIDSHYVQSNEQHTNKVSVEDENRTNSVGNYTPMDENNTTRILDTRGKTCSTHQKVIISTENSYSNFENRNTFSNKKYRNNHPNVKQNTDSKSRKSNNFLANNKSKIKPPWKQMRPTAMERQDHPHLPIVQYYTGPPLYQQSTLRAFQPTTCTF